MTKSMLFGAPWLLAHKSMLKVNQPQKVSLYVNDYVERSTPYPMLVLIWEQCFQQVGAKPKKMVLAP
jgi:hypothetical protein